MTLNEFAKLLAIFCFCFGGLALLQGYRWVAAWLFGSFLKAVMRLPKLQGVALTMKRIGNVLCGVGICMWLYEHFM